MPRGTGSRGIRCHMCGVTVRSGRALGRGPLGCMSHGRLQDRASSPAQTFVGSSCIRTGGEGVSTCTSACFQDLSTSCVGVAASGGGAQPGSRDDRRRIHPRTPRRGRARNATSGIRLFALATGGRVHGRTARAGAARSLRLHGSGVGGGRRSGTRRRTHVWERVEAPWSMDPRGLERGACLDGAGWATASPEAVRVRRSLHSRAYGRRDRPD